MSALRFGIPAVVVLGLVVLLAFGLTRDPSAMPSALVGKPMPAFELPRLHQPDQLLGRKDLLGQISVVNVWASWCLGCRTEHPLLEALAERSGVALYGLNYKDERAAALRWLDEYGDPYVASGHDAEGTVGIEWGVAAVPETFVIDAQGIVRYKHVGALDRKALEETVIPLIESLRSDSA